MAATYNLTTNTGKVRALIGDTDVSAPIFQDEELAAFLSLEHENVRRGAALALETMASTEAYVQKAMSIMDLSTNGPATARALLDRARLLREQAAQAEATEDGGGFEIIEPVYDDFSFRERLAKELLRHAY